ncbi:hypothetical protein CW304_02365 [Bacillus sp. UFRGS-B20]|nr:hypothetical protein CW304_02365 [Bacillus sp. UFRGS-B20]
MTGSLPRPACKAGGFSAELMPPFCWQRLLSQGQGPQLQSALGALTSVFRYGNGVCDLSASFQSVFI